MKDLARTVLLVVMSITVVGVGLWLLTYFTQYFEGVASIGLLVVAVFVLFLFGKDLIGNRNAMITFVVVFCFLGMILDGAGNFIYNLPIRFMCPSETTMSRELILGEDSDGNTTYSHVFSCYADYQEVPAKSFPTYLTIGIRAVEYLLIGSFLLGVFGILNRSRLSKS